MFQIYIFFSTVSQMSVQNKQSLKILTRRVLSAYILCLDRHTVAPQITNFSGNTQVSLDLWCGFDPDKIAIPDFGTGAMENWGLITYRETNLLYDENQSSSYNKQRVASVIAHELVHQVPPIT